MKIHHLFMGLIAACFATACTTSPASECVEIHVSPEHYKASICWSECSDTKLAQDADIPLVGVIDKVICHENHFLINSTGKLFLFDRTGNFLGQIGRQGRTTDEYIGITDCWIEEGYVWLYDMNGKKLLKYTLDNQVVSVVSLNAKVVPGTRPFAFLTPLGKGYVGRCTWNGVEGGSPALALYNKDFSFNQIIGDLTIRCGLRIGYPLIGADNSVLYWNPFGRTIYRIMPDATVKQEYLLSFGNKNYPDLETVRDDYDVLDLYQDEVWRKSHAGLIGYVWETEENLFFTYSYNGYMYLGVYDRAENKISNYRLTDSAQTKIASCAFDGETIFFFVEQSETTTVYSLNLSTYGHS